MADDVWPDAVSSVSVHVRELRDEAIYNSGSLRLAGMIETLSLSYTHTHTTADWFCLNKLQFLPKEADVDPPGVPLIDICSYKQLRNLKKKCI